MTSNDFLVKKPEHSHTEMLKGKYDQLLGRRIEQKKSDMWLFPNLIDDELCQKAPPALFLTTEFDYSRKAAEQGANVYRKNNRLLAFGMIPGTTHFSYANFNLQRTDQWFAAFKSFTDKYL